MSKQVKQLTHRLKEFLYWKEETRKVSPALNVERVSHTNTISMFTWGSTLERNRSHVISAGRVSQTYQPLETHEDPHWRETAWMWSMWKNIFEGFKPEEAPKSSFKGETTFMFFMWKEFFTTAEFKSSSEDTHWCERIYVLWVWEDFYYRYRIKTAPEDPHWRETLQVFTLRQ